VTPKKDVSECRKADDGVGQDSLSHRSLLLSLWPVSEPDFKRENHTASLIFVRNVFFNINE